jgi:diguanylate cyclase (GGDEF)-like protein
VHDDPGDKSGDSKTPLSDSPLRGRRQSNTLRLDQDPAYVALARDRLTLVMLTGPSPGAVYTLGAGELTLGRDDELSWRIEDRGVSAHHARIYCHQGVFWLQDLGSTNGTYVSGKRVGEPIKLHDNDRIHLGENTLLRVTLQDATEQEATEALYRASVIDPLTGIYNRGHLENMLQAEFAYAVRHRQALAILFIDLDHFTEINNRYGHQAGDEVLRGVTRAIRKAIRTEDFLARYGGEEFVLVARGIDLNGSLVMAERVRRIIEIMEVPFRNRTIRVTASFGVACHEAASTYKSPQQLVAAADTAVYRAKADGRNCVREATEAPPSWQPTTG